MQDVMIAFDLPPETCFAPECVCHVEEEGSRRLSVVTMDDVS